jgi:hypothetical protein
MSQRLEKSEVARGRPAPRVGANSQPVGFKSQDVIAAFWDTVGAAARADGHQISSIERSDQRRMLRVPFYAIALVFGIAWIGEASAGVWGF